MIVTVVKFCLVDFLGGKYEENNKVYLRMAWPLNKILTSIASCFE